MTTFDFSFSGPAEHTGALPRDADLVVIGGGIIGVMTAWYARQMGQSVVLVEKGRVACEQSSRNWGWVRQQGRHLAELPLAMEALRLWPDLQATAGVDLGFRRTGVMYIATSKRAEAEFEDWLAAAKPFGVDSHMVTRAELSQHFPSVHPSWRAALLTPSDGRAEPMLAVPAIARALAAQGAVLRENCAARALQVEAGRVVGVITEAGTIRANRVVLAGGAWSSLFLRNHGVSIPQLSVRATVAATEPMADMAYVGGAEDEVVAWRKRLDGGYSLAQGEFHEYFIGPDSFRHLRRFLPVLARDPLRTRLIPAAPKGYPDAWGTRRHWRADEASPFERMRVLNPRPNQGRLRAIARNFEARFPSLGPVNWHQAWAGMIDVMPDDIPIVDHVPALPGLILATGMCGHGFGIGPAMGRAVAQLASDQKPEHDLSAFRFSRF